MEHKSPYRSPEIRLLDLSEESARPLCSSIPGQTEVYTFDTDHQYGDNDVIND